MRTFQELLARYQIQVDQYAKESGVFKEDETDVDARKDTQGKLIRGFQSKPVLGFKKPQPHHVEAQKKIRERIKLYQQQLKYTQGMQELELQKKEMSFLLGELQADKAKFTDKAPLDQNAKAQEELRASLAEVDAKIKQLHTEKRANTLAEVSKYANKITLPKKSADYKSKTDIQNGLIVQQKRALELSVAQEENDFWQREYAKDTKIKPAWLAKMTAYLQRQAVAMDTASHLLVANNMLDETTKGMPMYGAQTLGQRGQTHHETITRLQGLIQEATTPKTAATGLPKRDAAFMAELNGSAGITQKLVADVQDAVQIILTRVVKNDEVSKQIRAGYKIMQRFMTADPLTETSEYVQKLLKDPRRDVLKGLVAASANFKELDEKIAVHKDKETLTEYETKLMQVAQNDVVQGPFLLDKRNLLVKAKSNEADDEFFALTNSANGDYNDPKNLGQYIYHVTALANILRTADSGIGVTGLSPGQGGKLGGSCEIADTRKDFSETGVDIKTGSVVNSQNKVAAASNRNEAMQVYIKQREDHVAQVMQESKQARTRKKADIEDAKAKQAAKDTATMLRFPIRAEYLGKFTNDPMHLTANLQLLDGTPVPPKDIDCLVHKQWINITNAEFVKTFKEMFALG